MDEMLYRMQSEVMFLLVQVGWMRKERRQSTSSLGNGEETSESLHPTASSPSFLRFHSRGTNMYVAQFRFLPIDSTWHVLN